MRIRSIKPEFWRSDDVNEMTIEDRLLFIGLWSYVDDNGVGIDRHSSICADLFAHDLSVSPHDTLKRVQDGLSRLHSLGVIVRYSVENKDYLEIVNWSKHQKINRPSPGRYPTSDGAKAKTHDPLTDDSVRPHESSLPGTEEQGNRGTGEQGKKATRKRVAAKPEPSDAEKHINDVTDAAYEAINKSAKYIALRQVAKWCVNDRGVTAEQFTAAVVAVYELGKPITKQTIGQQLDGYLGRGGFKTRDQQANDTAMAVFGHQDDGAWMLEA